MSRSAWLAASALWLAAAVAHAHAHLTRSEPPEASSGKAPTEMVLSFSESARLTLLTLQRAGGQPQKLAPPTEPGSRLTIPLPHLGAGSYTLNWRALSGDGHVTSGAVHFVVVEAASGGPQDAPHRSP
ncbi:MAG: copper resistance protein CopC [Gammaproteobacteria bacterium]|nr:copper resistance protein CopC [Gammaproteobacteria bacterium]MBV8306953.1 copper resistance protein CopC [Gammaproteobacteria bacterium]MBV8404790.1 copper resistance protein CopC [Gammaproteobacteria bacterium]